MGRESWIRAHYPVYADDECRKNVVGETPKERTLRLIDHSLRKWRGFLPEATKVHRVVRSQVWLKTMDGHVIHEAVATSCTLCIASRVRHSTSYCHRCPITQSGGRECDTTRSAYDLARVNPQHMVDQLQKTREWVEQQPDDYHPHTFHKRNEED